MEINKKETLREAGLTQSTHTLPVDKKTHLAWNFSCVLRHFKGNFPLC